MGWEWRPTATILKNQQKKNKIQRINISGWVSNKHSHGIVLEHCDKHNHIQEVGVKLKLYHYYIF